MRLSITAAQQLLRFLENAIAAYRVSQPLVPTARQRAATMQLVACTKGRDSLSVSGWGGRKVRAYAANLQQSLLEAAFEFRFREAQFSRHPGRSARTMADAHRWDQQHHLTPV